MREDEAKRIEEGLDFEPEAQLGADAPIGFWICESCGLQNSELDGECDNGCEAEARAAAEDQCEKLGHRLTEDGCTRCGATRATS